MTDYVKITDYAAKDALLTGNPAKLVKGTEIGADFDAVAVAVATKANSADPTFTGVVSFPDGSAAAPSITNTGDVNTGIFFPAADTVAVSTGGSERIRTDASGNVLIGTSGTLTGFGSANLTVNGTSTYAVFANDAAVNAPAYIWNKAASGDNLFSAFYTEASATLRGSIDFNRGGAVTRYNTSSDATLKNIIGDADLAKSVALLNDTRIREYSWKDDPTNKAQIGVIAQEVYAAGFEGAVSVGGDITEKDDEGNDVTKYRPWAVDKTAWTFHLVAGFQAQQKLIAQLEARIAALELANVAP